MDLIRDPLGWGSEDPEAPGVFRGIVRVRAGARVPILYAIPDLEARQVAIADIRTG
jgi:hypothetical protein